MTKVVKSINTYIDNSILPRLNKIQTFIDNHLAGVIATAWLLVIVITLGLVVILSSQSALIVQGFPNAIGPTQTYYKGDAAINLTKVAFAQDGSYYIDNQSAVQLKVNTYYKLRLVKIKTFAPTGITYNAEVLPIGR